LRDCFDCGLIVLRIYINILCWVYIQFDSVSEIINIDITDQNISYHLHSNMYNNVIDCRINQSIELYVCIRCICYLYFKHV